MLHHLFDEDRYLARAAAGVPLLGPTTGGGSALDVLGAHLRRRQAAPLGYTHGEASTTDEHEADAAVFRGMLKQPAEREGVVDQQRREGHEALRHGAVSRGHGHCLRAGHPRELTVPLRETVQPARQSLGRHRDHQEPPRHRQLRMTTFSRPFPAPLGMQAWWCVECPGGGVAKLAEQLACRVAAPR